MPFTHPCLAFLYKDVTTAKHRKLFDVHSFQTMSATDCYETLKADVDSTLASINDLEVVADLLPPLVFKHGLDHHDFVKDALKKMDEDEATDTEEFRTKRKEGKARRYGVA